MSPKKILVAEDDPELLDLLVTALKKEGFEVITSTHGLHAEGTLKNNTFDLLILDVMLPGKTGLHVATLAAALSSPPKIMTISARRNISEGQLAWAGVDMHIDKPFEIDDFMSSVRKLCQ